ncbi:MAG: ribosome-associated translation inhibitor RaiA [Hyphomonadaceae bacterium]|nr:ribosome-associated translation inhibitor RaiA [Hyphomonadaceae bacterium]
MTIKIAGRHMDVGDALSERISDGLEAAVTKYFDRSFDANVTVEKRGHEVITDCNVHLPSGIVLQSTGAAHDPYASLEDSLEKMEKRVRRYHRRLKDHHKRSPLPSEPANAFIIKGSDDETPEDKGEAPLIVAESASDVKTMSVSEAVMQLELSDTPAVLFRNVKHSGLNMVYRRADGNIGWVDPAGHSATG